ncbi:hypothetical protein MRB53_039027 [Persea americana]|nr:hypothetical protein MRB53_039027 [Persea americana]
MHSSTGLAALSLLPLAALAQETVVGVYMFHRHGDRTAKAWPPANLTDLGYSEVYTSGQYYRNRYVSSTASSKIAGLNTDIVKLSQIAVSAPSDNVLMSSALGFCQSLYPPVGSGVSTQVLANGTNTTAPMNGYQLIPVATVTSGTGSEDNTWLQASTGCSNAVLSSNAYFYTPEYLSTLNATTSFYQGFVPSMNGTYPSSSANYKNAYAIFDLLNVASIHNSTFNPTSGPFAAYTSADNLTALRNLANTHEFNLAYNATSFARAIAGAQLAAEVLQFLNGTIAGGAKQKLGVQFGAYASFQSFFGLANMTVPVSGGLTTDQANLFYGIPDYASVAIFELLAPTSNVSAALANPSSMSVRFLFHNGTTSDSSAPQVFPLFGSTYNGSDATMPWNTFVQHMSPISVGTTQQWCQVCGNSTGACAPYATSTSSTSNSTAAGAAAASSSAAAAEESGHGISKAVAGVIGAMVTLGVLLIVEAAVMLGGGLRLVSKKRLQQVGSPAGSGWQGVRCLGKSAASEWEGRCCMSVRLRAQRCLWTSLMLPRLYDPIKSCACLTIPRLCSQDDSCLDSSNDTNQSINAVSPMTCSESLLRSTMPKTILAMCHLPARAVSRIRSSTPPCPVSYACFHAHESPSHAPIIRAQRLSRCASCSASRTMSFVSSCIFWMRSIKSSCAALKQSV